MYYFQIGYKQYIILKKLIEDSFFLTLTHLYPI